MPNSYSNDIVLVFCSIDVYLVTSSFSRILLLPEDLAHTGYHSQRMRRASDLIRLP